jgi:hypothetical protein
MKTLLIFYDLIKPETSSDYENLIERIKNYSAWAKPCESTWFISTEDSPSKVRDDLKTYIDSNDKIVVIDVTGSYWATFGISQTITDWMKKNI